MQLNDNSTIGFFYSLIISLFILGTVYFCIITASTITRKLKPFSTKSEVIMLILTTSIIANHQLLGDPSDFFNGYMFSDLFDIAFIFSSFLLFYLLIISFIKFFERKSHKVSDEKKSISRSDNPIESLKDDQLNRADFAMKLGDSLEKQGNDSITIGLFGEWGSGKSSIYNMVKEHTQNIYKDSNIIYIDFKPWYFGKDDHDIIRIFLFQFLEEIKKTDAFSLEIERAIKQYANVLSSLSIGSMGTTFTFKEIADKFSPGEESINLADLKNEIESLLNKSPKKIVVYIDDMDRLEGSEIRMIFKLVRLVADFPKVTYIIALDEEIVAKSLIDIYGNEGQNNIVEGKRYLEKFIQIPIYLPKLENVDLRELYKKRLNAILLENKVMDTYVDDIVDSLIELKFYPRNFYRYIHLVQFYLPFLKEEVNQKDLLKIIMIQVKSSELYNFIYENKHLFLQATTNPLQEEISHINNIYQIKEMREVVISLFPRSATLLLKNSSDYEEENEDNEDKWEREKRICTFEFFDHYFKYTTPTNKVSQKDLTNLINLIKNDRVNDVEEEYLILVEKYTMYELNDRLYNRIEEIEDSLEKLFKVLTKLYINQEEKELTGLFSFINKIAKKMYFRDYDFTFDFWKDTDIFLLLELDKNSKEKNDIQYKYLKEALRYSYKKISDNNFLDEYSENEAVFLWENWDKYFGLNEIRKFIKKWIESKEDFVDYLHLTFNQAKFNSPNEKNFLVGDQLELMSKFEKSMKLLPEETLNKFFDYNFDNFDIKSTKDVYNSKLDSLEAFLSARAILDSYTSQEMFRKDMFISIGEEVNNYSFDLGFSAGLIKKNTGKKK